ncbi:MAG: C4-dicarboxylate ABC transporter permease [Spiribacter salinus]|uniref:C4-dicarboxylate ABC transporter permease n=1 Tax=Spiribacter salinus TaxID=1335746 RepID=A0A540VR86_9GAMM|nr:MAG: C4-dicarboxylate ABC transporter permease [Spiribacter salinus]
MIGEILSATGILTEITVLAWLVAGVAIGVVFGATPGLTGTAGVAIAVPLTFALSFTHSMGLLLGLYVGGYFAGSIPAILINTPGAPGNAASSLEGYPMAQRGEAERAMTLAVLASLVGGIVSVIVLAAAAQPLSRFALGFQSAEYFALGLLGMLCVAAVSRGSLPKGLAAAMLGALLGTIGIDAVSGAQRLTFGFHQLQGGISLLPALLAFFAITEILNQLSHRPKQAGKLPEQQHIPLSRAFLDMWRQKTIALKGSIIGVFIGMLPGTGPTIAAWIGYAEAARTRRKDEPEMGSGNPRGLVAAEAANNAVTGGALVPMLTLGIPGDTVTAVLIGAFLIQGIDPGPFFIRTQGDLFAQILVLLLAANLIMVAMTLSLRRAFPLVLRIPMHTLVPIIAVLCTAGGFAVNNSSFDVVLIGILGVAGFGLSRLGMPMAPVVLGLVLGPIVEENLRNAVTAASGDWSIFISRPVSATLLAIVAIVLIGAFVAEVRRTRTRSQRAER